jgi:RND superfamily putative drug exporter
VGRDAAPTSPTLLARYARLVVRRRKAFLVGYLVLVLLAGGIGMQVLPVLQAEGFDNPSSQSAEVAQLLERDFDTRQPVAVIGATGAGSIDSPETTAAAKRLVAELQRQAGVDEVVSYWTAGRPAALRGNDDKTGEILVYSTPGADELAVARQLTENLGEKYDGLQLNIAGFGAVFNAVDDRVRSDLATAEMIAIPITIILLLFVFGSLVAAGLPFLVALLAILASFALLFLVTQVADVSIFALNLVTALGLGLGIDYALLMVNRFREELKRGATTEDAVVTTMTTAGKTALVSGLTVAFTLSSLIIFPQYFLKSFAYAGVAVSLMAVVGALTIIPAVLALLGPNVNRGKLLRGELAPRDDGVWARIARTSMRRPWLYLLGGVAIMLVLSYPALSLVVGQIDDRALPRDDRAATASRFLDERFPGYDGAPYEVLLLQPESTGALTGYARDISELPGVASVTTPDTIVIKGHVRGQNPDSAARFKDDIARVTVIGSVPPRDERGVALVQALRDHPAPAGEVLVGGIAAEYGDSNEGIVGNAWIVALWIGLTTLLIIFLYTGSVVLPIKALLLNVLSLSATLGVLVWIFQEGHLQWLTGDYIVTGTVDLTSIALVAVVAFALSMDYELFLLSRIKEEHDAGHGTEDSVAFGLQRTGRIITAAALLIAIVFAAFLSSGVTSIKQLGLGAAFAIMIDATLVRGILVPTFMRVAGDVNWWAPAWLRRLHARIGIREG